MAVGIGEAVTMAVSAGAATMSTRHCGPLDLDEVGVKPQIVHHLLSA